MTNGLTPRAPLEVLKAAMPAGKLVGGQWRFRCPSHQDRNPSLVVRELPDGRLLLRCHAGCRSEDVLDALGLEWADLYPAEDGRWATW